jgi:Flp pilus assembly protein TadD
MRLLSLRFLLFLSIIFIFPAAYAHVQSGAPADGTSQLQASTRTEQSGQVDGTSSTAPHDYSKEAFVIEQLQSHYRFENDGSGRKESTFRVRVQSEAGLQSWGQLRFGYNSASEQLEIGYVRVIKRDGSVVKADQTAVQDLAPTQQFALLYTDYHEKHVTVPGLRPGDILECATVTTIHHPLAPGQFWMQYDFNLSSIVLDEQLDVDVPSGRSVKLKTRPGADPKITEEKGRRIYHWTSSHLVREDEDKDKDKDKKKKKKKDEFPAVQLTTFTSWEEIGRWYADLEKDRRQPSKEVRTKADALTKGMQTDLEKTQALYEFVAANFRYVSLSLGLARYQPHAAADVLHNQYGDCKDKHTLLAALLEAEGLHADTVLINSYRKIDPDVPSPAQFNHVITYLPLGNDKIWMDTTTEVAPFRLISWNLRKKQALVIPPQGAPHLEETPNEPGVSDTDSTQIAGKISDDGKLDATVNWTMRGDLELNLRMLFRRIPSTQWQKTVEALNKDIGGEVSNLKITDPSDTHNPFAISYDVSKERFLDWQKKKVELKLPLSILRPLAIGSDVGEDEEDQKTESPDEENFKLGPPSDRTYSLKLEFATRYSPQAPVAINLDRDYAKYQSTYMLEHSVFTAQRRFTIRLSELPPSRADDYRAFRNGVLSDTAQLLMIESATASSKTVPSGMGASELIKSGNEARNNGNYTLAIDLLNHAVEADPKSKLAWNDLGLAYFDSRQDDLAANAYHKQLEINPYDQNAYNNLGRIYLRQRKYDEAEKWFRKQLEVNPLDKYAHGNLGHTYLEWHKYEQSIPELTQAASLNPKKADPHVGLGEAYLNLGQDEKAMEAFDKAVQISATPAVWNNIAYQLSLKKSHVDLARRYAESAVATMAASSRNISLDQLSRRDLRSTSALATYWDTLGWVEFGDGNIDKALKCILPAWEVILGAEVGDHLGQIYEKRGDREKAQYFYAVSLNARNPLPETRERLSTLLGGDDKANGLIEKYRGELQRLRTIQLGDFKHEGTATGDFFVMLRAGTGSVATAQGVKFVGGDESLKSAADVLRAAKYEQSFPDDTPTTLLRRGTLACKSGERCTFLLAPPEDVSSAD